jgi:hypothetical protein
VSCNGQVAAANDEHAGEVAGLREELAEVSARLAATEAQHAAAQQAAEGQSSAQATLQAQHDGTTSRLAEAEAATSAAERQLAVVTCQLEEAQAEAAAARQEAEELHSRLLAAEDQLQEHSARSDSWESDCTGMKVTQDALCISQRINADSQPVYTGTCLARQFPEGLVLLARSCYLEAHILALTHPAESFKCPHRSADQGRCCRGKAASCCNPAGGCRGEGSRAVQQASRL